MIAFSRVGAWLHSRAPGPRTIVKVSSPSEGSTFDAGQDRRENKADEGQYYDPRDEIVGAIQIARGEDEGADAAIGADHLGRDEQDDRDRDGDAKAREHRRERTGEHDLADDRAGRQVEALPHYDEVTLHIVD